MSGFAHYATDQVIMWATLIRMLVGGTGFLTLGRSGHVDPRF
jgi:Trk-type K+ transport system membrane component